MQIRTTSMCFDLMRFDLSVCMTRSETYKYRAFQMEFLAVLFYISLVPTPTSKVTLKMQIIVSHTCALPINTVNISQAQLCVKFCRNTTGRSLSSHAWKRVTRYDDHVRSPENPFTHTWSACFISRCLENWFSLCFMH